MLRTARSREPVNRPVPSTASGRHDEGRPAGPAGVTRALERLADGQGHRGRAVAARVDLASAYGVGPLMRRLRAERRLSNLGPEARDRVYEEIWRRAAEDCGAGVVPLSPGLLELHCNGARTRVHHQLTTLDDPVTLRVALDKAAVHRLMDEAGVPHADHLEWTADDPGPAASFLADAGGPCVVKPAAGTGGGDGVVPGVESGEDLLRARWHAGSHVDRLLIERQVNGSVYRLLLLDGELLDVVRSVPANVTGDGHSTIEELIVRENERRVAAGGTAGLSFIGLNLDTIFTLRRAGLTLSSVLPNGHHLPLRVATNNNAARDNETWRGEVDESVLEHATAAVSAVGLRLAGVDVLTPDITRPLTETGGVVSEVNGGPGLHHHYLVADAENATPVAVHVLQRLLALVVVD
jgi:cyanophycin synthetase